MTAKEFYERDAIRKKRRKAAAAFIAKMNGKKPQPSKAVVIEQLDRYTSMLVRRRDHAKFGGLCVICMAKQRLGLLKRQPEYIQLGYHILPRGDGMVHWDMRNVVGACFKCNGGELWSRTKFSLRERYRAIHIEAIGETTLLELEALARQTSHFTTADLIAMRDERKKQLETAE